MSKDQRNEHLNARITELNDLSNKVEAIEQALIDFDKFYKSGDEDIGRVSRLKQSRLEEQKAILAQIRTAVLQTPAEDLVAVIDAIQFDPNTPNPSAKEQLIAIANKKNLGTLVLEKLKENKGGIIGLVVGVGIAILKEVLT